MRCYDLISGLYSNIPEAKQRRMGISSTQFYEGVFYLNSFSLKVDTKAGIIEKYIPEEKGFHPLIIYLRKDPRIYSIISNIVSPLFHRAIWLKRKLKN